MAIKLYIAKHFYAELIKMAATKPSRVTRQEGSYKEVANRNFREVQTTLNYYRVFTFESGSLH